MTEYVQVITTTPTKEMALAIAEALVARHLAGCVQVSGPITSVYRWQGQIESAQEWVCTAKTRGDLFSRIEQEIVRLHTYDTPEILATPITEGSAQYLAWLAAEVVVPNPEAEI